LFIRNRARNALAGPTGCRGMTAIGWCGRWNIAATVSNDPADPVGFMA